jgi:quercetin dioxygenase-like cupin family protein
MEIKRVASLTAAAGPADWFHGDVRVQRLFEAPDPAPGARTAWHTHPLGQTLIVTAGVGWAQREGGEVEEIQVGDVVWFAPGEKHWHGASRLSAMTHVAIQEASDGQTVEWLEHVTDAEYRR